MTPPVECLGQRFPDDAARRAYFLRRLQTKLADHAFRQLAGFADATDAAILALSDPPYYTACPNPFLADFLADNQIADARPDAGPFAADVRVQRHDPYSLAHTYHTKVSPLAVVQYVRHFTRPGDVVLDLFCGSGMTGLAAAGADPGGRAALLADRPRRAVLIDLSPAATHIAAGHAARPSEGTLAQVAELLRQVRRECRALYAVPHSGEASRHQAWAGRAGSRGGDAELDYLVWSEVLLCPRCGGDFAFGERAYDPAASRVKASFTCPHCGTDLRKRQCQRRVDEYDDPLLGRRAWRPRLVPLFTAYRYQTDRFYRRARPADAGPLAAYDPAHAPAAREVLRGERYHKDALRDVYGVTHVHHFYTPRNLQALGGLLAAAGQAAYSVARLLRFVVTSVAVKASRLMNYNADGVGRVLKGTLYGSSLAQECNPFWLAELALKDLARFTAAARHDPRHIVVSTQSAAAATLPPASVDYVWVDPPFGKSLMYAELNQLWEWWLGVRTADGDEAVLDPRRGKDLARYRDLLTACFAQAYRALKPGRWMTVAFHNSEGAVWDAIQEALGQAGFVVADVRALDKRLLTYKQSQQGLAKVDLVISAYRPGGRLRQPRRLKAGSAAAAWRFVRRHLASAPTGAERTRDWLFDRMVADHVRRGVRVPLSAKDFFAELPRRFVERDGRYFLR